MILTCLSKLLNSYLQFSHKNDREIIKPSFWGSKETNQFELRKELLSNPNFFHQHVENDNKNNESTKKPLFHQNIKEASPLSLQDVQAFISQLFPLFVEYWLECSPSQEVISIGESGVIDATSNVETMLMLLDIVSIVFTLEESVIDSQRLIENNVTANQVFVYRKFELSVAKDYLEQFLKHVFAYFPFTYLKNNKKVNIFLI